MPYTIERDGPHLQITFLGSIEPRDLSRVALEAKSYEGGDVVPHRITDLSRVDKLNISFEDVFQLAAARKLLRFSNTFKSALVVSSDIQMGYARMFQTLNDHPQITLRIFESAAAARVWLDE